MSPQQNFKISRPGLQIQKYSSFEASGKYNPVKEKTQKEPTMR